VYNACHRGSSNGNPDERQKTVFARPYHFPLLFLVFAGEISAGTILDVAGPNNWPISPAANPDQFGNHAYLVASWTQTIEYSGVDISLRGNGISSTATGTAYLTTSMGGGTTVADQLAVTAFTAPAAPSSWISLFSGLTLPANSYYLMIFADPGSVIAWDATSPDSATTTLGIGVTLTSSFLYDGLALVALVGSYAPYPPATVGFGFQDNLIINVTGVPEPSSLTLMAGAALASLVLWRRSNGAKRKMG
jgi:hypothetical protein